VKVAIIDYTAGNIGSLVNAFRRLRAEVIVTRSREDAVGADAVVLLLSTGMVSLT